MNKITNGRTERKVEDQLRACLHLRNEKSNTEHLQKTIAFASNELCYRRQKERITFGAFLLRQIPYIAWRLWLAQGMVLILLCTMFYSAVGDYGYQGQRYVAVLLCYTAIVILMTSIPFIHRSIQYQMQETEAASRFSSLRLLAAKLLILVIGDGVMMGGIVWLAVFQTSVQLGSAILYLTIPFLAVSSGYLYLLGHVRARLIPVLSSAMCLLLSVILILVNRFYPMFFYQTMTVRWAGVCIILLLFCYYQLRHMMRRASYIEMQLS